MPYRKIKPLVLQSCKVGLQTLPHRLDMHQDAAARRLVALVTRYRPPLAVIYADSLYNGIPPALCTKGHVIPVDPVARRRVIGDLDGYAVAVHLADALTLAFPSTFLLV